MSEPPRQPAPQRIRFEDFEADLRTEELSKSGTRLRLPHQSFCVLAMLLERPGQLVTREELRARLWPASTLIEYDQRLNAAVNRLREALLDAAEAPRFIETLPKRGYRFIAAIEPVLLPAPPVTPAFAGELTGANVAAPPEVRHCELGRTCGKSAAASAYHGPTLACWRNAAPSKALVRGSSRPQCDRAGCSYNFCDDRSFTDSLCLRPTGRSRDELARQADRADVFSRW